MDRIPTPSWNRRPRSDIDSYASDASCQVSVVAVLRRGATECTRVVTNLSEQATFGRLFLRGSLTRFAVNCRWVDPRIELTAVGVE